MSVTVEVPDPEPFACDTALTAKVVVTLLALPSDLVGTPLGATYKPVVEINPKAWLPPTMPLTCQMTAELGAPFTDAVNCCVPKFATDTALGDMLTELEAPVVAITVTGADANFVASAWEVAVTLTCGGLGTVDGAVYKPEFVIVPLDTPPPTLHVTALLVVPATVAVNCCVFPTPTLALGGAMVTEITGVVLFDVAAQPDHRKTERQPRKLRTDRRMRILTGGRGSSLQRRKQKAAHRQTTHLHWTTEKRKKML